MFIGIYIDYTKAFDYLNHALLLKKLQLYGFRGIGLTLLRSYLGSRRQYVSPNGYSSEMKPLLSGVPHGSILGPLLFNLYISDIVNIDKATKFIIYADDTTLLLSHTSPVSLATRAYTTLAELSK